jgi:hypothetical protein
MTQRLRPSVLPGSLGRKQQQRHDRKQDAVFMAQDLQTDNTI